MGNLTKILVSGASMSKGIGLPGGRTDPRLWSTQLANNIWPNNSITNIAQMGHNPDTIFVATLDEITKNSYDHVIVEWSLTTASVFHIGLELYSTKSNLFTNRDYNLCNNRTVTGEWLYKNIKMNLNEVLNDHWAILKMVEYLNILARVQLAKGKIWFVNGLGVWPRNYFTKQKSWQDSDNYTKNNILQKDFRDDNTIEQLYDKIHTSYADAGGIQENLWLNLYDSMQESKIDTISESDPHPGVLSQDKYAVEFTKRINEILKLK